MGRETPPLGRVLVGWRRRTERRQEVKLASTVSVVVVAA